MTSPIDTLGMLDATLALPEQIQSVLDSVGPIDGLPDPDRIEHVLILGMGDSGFGGDVAAASARPFSSIPIVVYGGYLPPSWVGPSSLVIAISASGTTEETLESLEAAVEAGASLVSVTAGGELEELTRHAHGPVLPVVDQGPMPRTSLGSLAVPPMLALEQLGLFPVLVSGWLTPSIS
ncbi:MAG: SIS domain-containing protein [Acidimicrobiales bacterium]